MSLLRRGTQQAVVQAPHTIIMTPLSPGLTRPKGPEAGPAKMPSPDIATKTPRTAEAIKPVAPGGPPPRLDLSAVQRLAEDLESGQSESQLDGGELYGMPLTKDKKLNNWLNRSLPFDGLTMDTMNPDSFFEPQLNNSRLFVSGRLAGAGLLQRLSEYWRELFDRDRRLFLRQLLKGMGLTLDSDTHCAVSAARLCRQLRQMGINARSDQMYYLCDMLEWFDDDTVSLARWRDVVGDVEDPPYEDLDWDAILGREPPPRSPAKIDRLGSADSGGSAETIPSSIGGVMRMATESRTQLTGAALRVIAELYDCYENNRLTGKELVESIENITGVSHGDRVRSLIEGEIRRPLTYRDLLCAVYRDVKDQTDEKGRPKRTPMVRSGISIRRVKPKPKPPAVSPITGLPLTCEELVPSLSDDELEGLMDDATRVRLQDVLVHGLRFPAYPDEKDCTFIQNIAKAFSCGWMTSFQLKQLLDTWKLELNPKLTRAIKTHATDRKSIFTDIYYGLRLALEQRGVHWPSKCC